MDANGAAAARPPVPAGWYVDPARPTFERWWTGTEWTDAFRPKSASQSFWTVTEDSESEAPPIPPPAIPYPNPNGKPSDDYIVPDAGGITGATVRSSFLRGLLLGIPMPSRKAMRKSTARFNEPTAYGSPRSAAEDYRAAKTPTVPVDADNTTTEHGSSEGEKMTEPVPAGWYVDPARPLFERWWTGAEWTPEFRPKSASKSFWTVDAGPSVTPPWPPPPIAYPVDVTKGLASADEQQGLAGLEDVANSAVRGAVKFGVPNARVGRMVADQFFPDDKSSAVVRGMNSLGQVPDKIVSGRPVAPRDLQAYGSLLAYSVFHRDGSMDPLEAYDEFDHRPPAPPFSGSLDVPPALTDEEAALIAHVESLVIEQIQEMLPGLVQAEVENTLEEYGL